MSVRMQKQATPATALDKSKSYPSSSLTPVAMASLNEDGDVMRWGGITTQDYRLVKVTYIFHGTTTYTPTSGVRALRVVCIGAGGAGGGAESPPGSQASQGGGGGGGAYSEVWSTANVSGAHDVVIGTGGTAGTAGNNPGNAGGDTSFKDSAGTVICLAKGGSGGGGDAAVAAPHIGADGGAGGLASAGTGDVKQDGCPGGTGMVLNNVSGGGRSGEGGKGYQAGGNAIRRPSGTGNAATGYGGGGAGGGSFTGLTNFAGGAGGNGLIIVWEFA